MASPITPTPTLRGKEAEAFLKKVKDGLARPAKMTPTPKIERAPFILFCLSRGTKNGLKK